MKRRRPISQSRRLAIAAVDLVLLVCVTYACTGQLAAPPGGDGLWFFSAVLAVVLADLVVEPWYTRPADALVNAAAALVAVLTVNGDDLSATPDGVFVLGRALLVVLFGVVLLSAVVAMASKPSSRGVPQSSVHRYSYVLASSLGRARIVFAVLFGVAAAATFADDVPALLSLYLFLLLVVLERVPEQIIRALGRPDVVRPQAITVGRTVEPRLAVLASEAHLKIGQRVATDDGVEAGVVVHAWRSADGPAAELLVTRDLDALRPGQALHKVAGVDGNLLGTATVGTDLDRLLIRTSTAQAERVGIEEGSLVHTTIRGDEALYQVVAADIVSGSPHLEADAMRLSVAARKLGSWKADLQRFVPVPWIPDPGEAVGALEVARTEPSSDFIGYVPGSTYGVAFDPHEGITHNTAVFGILGSGKTRVAADLAWRVVAEGGQVVVLDLTDQWPDLFAELDAKAVQGRFHDAVTQDIAGAATSKAFDGENAGNVGAFRRSVKAHVGAFLQSDDPVLVCNPAHWTVTQELGFARNARAELLRGLTPAEVTACFARAILDLVSDQERTHVRVCLVLEEAHSLAPEWNAVAHEKEKQATIATSRAILQGRKFGFGTLVVTQRTANVTKTVLNQCNTVISLRVYDQTGAEFMSHFIGSDYSALLATLPERTAVVFGRGSSCQSPVLVKVNDWAVADGLRRRVAAERVPDLSEAPERNGQD